MPKAKRFTLSLSKDVMTFFKKCHKTVGARSIGQSVRETILNLRHELEESKGAEYLLTDPFTGKPLSQREIAHIKQIRRDKGFATTKEAFAYLRGRIEQGIELRLGARALNKPVVRGCSDVLQVNEETRKTHPCPSYEYDNKIDKVLCSRDLKKRGVVYRVSKGICDMCWNHQVEQACTKK